MQRPGPCWSRSAGHAACSSEGRDVLCGPGLRGQPCCVSLPATPPTPDLASLCLCFFTCDNGNSHDHRKAAGGVHAGAMHAAAAPGVSSPLPPRPRGPRRACRQRRLELGSPQRGSLRVTV